MGRSLPDPSLDARMPRQALRGAPLPAPPGAKLESHTVVAHAPDPFAFLAEHEGHPRVLFVEAGEGVAGAGIAAEMLSTGPDRFAALDRQARAWAAGLRHTRGPGVPPNVGPRWVGGLAFAPAAAPSPDFPDARFLLPRRQLTLLDGGAYVTTTGEPLERGPARPASPPGSGAGRPAWRSEPDFEPWATAVRGALDAVRRGEIEKVVLARSLTARLSRPPDLVRVLSRLAARAPDACTFLVEPRPGAAFLGATPELLVARAKGRMRTSAVAGSRARGRTPDEDEALARNLVASSKDAWEHELVARYLRAALGRRAVPWTTTAERRVLRTPHVQHLSTEYEAESPAGDSLLGLAAALHPTPAVGGAPPGAALGLLERIEARARGWYAGPVGWFDAAGDGELMVAIRSAFVADADVTLWAGCGIVEGSDPAEEWEESRAKFRLLQTQFDAEAST